MRRSPAPYWGLILALGILPGYIQDAPRKNTYLNPDIIRLDLRFEVISPEQFRVHLVGQVKLPDRTVVTVRAWAMPWPLPQHLSEEIRRLFHGQPALLQTMRVTLSNGAFHSTIPIGRSSYSPMVHSIEARVDPADQNDEKIRKILNNPRGSWTASRRLFLGVSPESIRTFKEEWPRYLAMLEESRSLLGSLKQEIGKNMEVPPALEARRLALSKKWESLRERPHATVTFSILQTLLQWTTHGEMGPVAGQPPQEGTPGGVKDSDKDQTDPLKERPSPDSEKSSRKPQSAAYPLDAPVSEILKRWDTAWEVLNTEYFLAIKLETLNVVGTTVSLTSANGGTPDKKNWPAFHRDIALDIQHLSDLHAMLVKDKSAEAYQKLWAGQDLTAMFSQSREYLALIEKRGKEPLKDSEKNRMADLRKTLEGYLP